ncbi:MAG: hypothetical protein IJ618_02130 [Prevotella sp.]|nr:hypothetical protein [Prevotella sp.]
MKKFFLMMLAVTLSSSTGYAKVSGTESEPTTPDGVEAVDLGLSVKWANVNLGAKKSSDFGAYYAWGETKPKSYYGWDTYLWSRGNTQFLTKYSTSDGKSQLDSSDDAARANWGGDWRMPTAEEYEELVNPDNCKWEWITKDGVNGYKVTGKKTGKSIFLPITGFRFYAGIQFRAVYGYYWTSSLYRDNPNKAWCLEFNFSDVNVHHGKLSCNRFSGRCIRAVSTKGQ